MSYPNRNDYRTAKEYRYARRNFLRPIIYPLGFVVACFISLRGGVIIGLFVLGVLTFGFIEAGATAKQQGRTFWNGFLFGTKGHKKI